MNVLYIVNQLDLVDLKTLISAFMSDKDTIYIHTKDESEKFFISEYEPTVEFLSGDLEECITKFMNTDIRFDRIETDRVLHNISPDNLLIIMSIFYKISNPECEFTHIVPDFNLLAIDVNILNTKNETKAFIKSIMDVHKLLLNNNGTYTKSLWTDDLAKYYLEVENYWKVTKTNRRELDNRSLYMELNGKRV